MKFFMTMIAVLLEQVERCQFTLNLELGTLNRCNRWNYWNYWNHWNALKRWTSLPERSPRLCKKRRVSPSKVWK